MTRKELIELAQAAPDDALDEMVHDMYSQIASETNNGGPEAQITALMEWGFTAAQIEKAIKEATP